MKKNYTLSLDIEPVQILREDGLGLSKTMNNLLRAFIADKLQKKAKKEGAIYNNMKDRHNDKTVKQLKSLINLLLNAPDTPENIEKMAALRQLIEEKQPKDA